MGLILGSFPSFWNPWDPWGRVHIYLNKNSVRTVLVMYYSLLLMKSLGCRNIHATLSDKEMSQLYCKMNFRDSCNSCAANPHNGVNLFLKFYIHYAPLMMSQKESPLGASWVIPRKVDKMVWISAQFSFEKNDGCFLLQDRAGHVSTDGKKKMMGDSYYY